MNIQIYNKCLCVDSTNTKYVLQKLVQLPQLNQQCVTTIYFSTDRTICLFNV